MEEDFLGLLHMGRLSLFSIMPGVYSLLGQARCSAQPVINMNGCILLYSVQDRPRSREVLGFALHRF